MITIWYKSKFSSMLRALSAIAIGAVMIASNDATITVVRVIASLLFAAGVISFIYGYVNRRKGVLSLMSINAVVDIIIGLLLFFFPDPVSHLIVYLIGIMLIGFGALQLLAMSSIMSLLGSGFMSLVLSIAAIIGGIVLLFNPFSVKVMSILAGFALILYGIQELRSAWQMDKAKKEYEIKFGSPDSNNGSSASPNLNGVKDVEYHKVDDK